VRLTEQPPNIIGGTMRPYQLDGLNWMITLFQSGLRGAILADEMVHRPLFGRVSVTN
jgi:SNF2 family DNA or RNA helicase